MNEAILKSFFVKLGWQVDAQGEKRVKEAIGSVTKGAAGLALALEAAAVAATAAVAKIASAFDQLYFTSQRTGASVQNIKALSYAFGQVGGSGGQAIDAIESFAKAMRTNPGIGQLVKDLGVTTTLNGKARDSFDVLLDAMDAIQRKYPYYAGAQVAGLLGISEETFNLLVRNRDELRVYREEYERTAKRVGLNTDEAAKASNRFMTALRGLQASATAVAEKISTSLLPVLTSYLNRIRDWIERNPEKIERIVTGIVTAAVALAKAFGAIAEALTPVGEGLVKLAELLTGKDGLEAAMTAFAAFLVGTWLVKILGAFTAVGLGWMGLLRTLGIPAAVIGGGALAGGLITKGIGPADVGAMTNPGRDGSEDAIAPRADPKGGERSLWQRGKDWVRERFGGGSAGSNRAQDEGVYRRAQRGRASREDKTNYNFTGENADVLRQAAKELGTSPEDLATVISYETRGTFSPSIRGGKNNRHIGLIQFGDREQADYGAHQGQTFAEQMGAVVRYLKSRKFKPGMGLMDLYSTINAGTPGRYNASDGNGTVRSHTETMRRSEAARVKKFLESGSQESPAPPAPADESGSQESPAPPAPADQRRFGVDAVKSPLASTRPANFDVAALTAAPPLGANPVYNSTSNNVTMNSPVSIKIDGATDPATTGVYVERATRRAAELNLRNAQTAIA